MTDCFTLACVKILSSYRLFTTIWIYPFCIFYYRLTTYVKLIRPQKDVIDTVSYKTSMNKHDIWISYLSVTYLVTYISAAIDSRNNYIPIHSNSAVNHISACGRAIEYWWRHCGYGGGYGHGYGNGYGHGYIRVHTATLMRIRLRNLIVI
jgi:hypothetical protein